MSGRDRRISPRKDCLLPLRFRVTVNASSPVAVLAGAAERGETVATPVAAGARTVMEGQVLNLSERGVYFHSRAPVSIGTRLEMFFTLPRELTGRSPEEVRCSALVVHVNPAEEDGSAGIGATVERFEPVAIRRWHH